MIKTSWANENDAKEIIEVANRIFAGDDNNYFQTYHPALYKDGVNTATQHIIIREDGKIKGLIGLFPAVMNVMGEKIEVCGLGTMCVEKECRGKGYMREIMEEALKSIKEAKTPISILGGRRQRYEYYGYTPSAICSNFYFNRDNAKHVFAGETEATYSFVTPSGTETEDFKKCLALYERRKAYTERTAEGFYDCLINCRTKPLFILKDGKVCGYACVSDSMHTMFEFEIEDNADCCRMLKDYINAFSINGVTAEQVFYFECEKIRALAQICEGTHISGVDSYLIQDYAKLFSAFGKLKASYTNIPDGEAIIEIEGVQKIKITASNGNITVTETDEAPQLTIKPLEAASAFFGQGAFTLGYGNKLPGFANALFPLPLFFSVPDMV